MRDRLNQLRDLIGHYQVGKMGYSVNIHQAVQCICEYSNAFEKEQVCLCLPWEIDAFQI